MMEKSTVALQEPSIFADEKVDIILEALEKAPCGLTVQQIAASHDDIGRARCRILYAPIKQLLAEGKIGAYRVAGRGKVVSYYLPKHKAAVLQEYPTLEGQL